MGHLVSHCCSAKGNPIQDQAQPFACKCANALCWRHCEAGRLTCPCLAGTGKTSFISAVANYMQVRCSWCLLTELLVTCSKPKHGWSSAH